MSTPQEQLLRLSSALEQHEGVTHWAISMRLLGRGDFFRHLSRPGRDIRYGTYQRILGKLSEAWPADLEWPADIPRPARATCAAEQDGDAA